jgi:hypothetical protein
MATMNHYVGALVVPAHPHDRARQLEKARILLSASAEELLRAEAFEPAAAELVDAIDTLLPRLRALVDEHEQQLPF